MRITLLEIDTESCRPKHRPRLDFSVEVFDKCNKKGGSNVEIKITTEQKVHVKLNPVTATGKPSSIDGKATFTVQDDGGSALTIVPDDDGLGAFLVSDDTATGSAILKVTADVNLDGAVEEDVSDTITVTITHPKASSLGLTADEPVAK